MNDPENDLFPQEKIEKNINELFQTGLVYHRQGLLQKAEKSYRQILDHAPEHFNALHMLGVLSCQNKELDIGIALLRKAAAMNPNSAQCHNNLGKALHDRGKPDEAISCYQQAISIDPDSVTAHINLGNALTAVGKCDEAIISCRNALELQPGSAEAYHNLANALENLNRDEEAVTAYRRALELKPDFATAHYNHGNLLSRLRKPEEAIKCYEQAITICPDYAEAYNNLGTAKNDISRPEEAIVCFQKALEVRPQFVEALNNLGITLMGRERYEEAVLAFKQAVQIRPDSSLSVGNLARVYEKLNRLDEAWETATKALECDPSSPIANLVAAKCERRNKRFHEALTRLNAIDPEGTDRSVHSHVLHEKGTIHDRLGEFAPAFEAFSRANALTAGTWSAGQIPKQAYLEKISRLHSCLADFSFDDRSPSGVHPARPDPIFLVGFPRSGTTLLEQVLATRPLLKTLEEKPLVGAMLNLLNLRGIEYPEGVPHLDQASLEDLREVYYLKASQFLPSDWNGVFVDKLPLNIVDIFLIHRVFPQAKILLSLRHPLDVCLSCFIQNFRLNESMIHFLTVEDAARLYDRVMSLWRTYTDRLPLKYHVLRYEDLVTDFENETKKLFHFLEIPWDASVWDYHQHAKSKGLIATPSYDQVVEPIYRRSMYRWKNYSKQLKPVFDTLRHHIAAFGYSIEDQTENPTLLDHSKSIGR